MDREVLIGQRCVVRRRETDRNSGRIIQQAFRRIAVEQAPAKRAEDSVQAGNATAPSSQEAAA